MNFLVKEVTERFDAFETVPLPYNKALISHSYPRQDNNDLTLFRTHVGLYNLHNLPRLHSETFFSIFFGEKYNQCVLLSQSKETSTRVWLLVLCETVNESEGKEGLTRIINTLLPFLHDGTVGLSEGLLDVVITPTPVSPDQMTKVVLEFMEDNPAGHPVWSSVVQALLHSVCENRSSRRHSAELVSSLIRKGGDLHRMNSSGVSPYDVVTNQSDGVEWLDTAVSETSKIETDIQSTEKKHLKKIQRQIIKRASVQQFPNDTSAKEDSNGTLPEPAQTKTCSSPLYSYIEKGSVKTSLFLLLSGTNPNFVDPVSGNTCLHLAAEQGNMKIIQMLLLFDADPDICNANGRTPQDVLAEVPEQQDLRKMLIVVSKLRIKYKSFPMDPVKKSSKEGEFLLALDGGGSRCISELQMLIAVENRMKQLDSKCKPLVSYFDYVAGTSGGALFTFVLIYNKTSLADARALNCTGAHYMGGNDVHSKTKNIETLLKSTLGDVRVMTDVQIPKVITIATLANQIPPKLHLVTNYGEPRDGQVGPEERKIWEAARMSSAAPTYFTSYDGFLDGGLMANNPTLDALAEMNKESMKNNGYPLKLSCALSVGSGRGIQTDIHNIDVSGNSFGFKGLFEKVNGYKNLLALVLSQVTQADGQDVGRAQAMCDIAGGDYYRLNAPVSTPIPLDTSEPVDLIQPMYDAFMYTLQNPELIDSIARNILSKSK